MKLKRALKIVLTHAREDSIFITVSTLVLSLASTATTFDKATILWCWGFLICMHALIILIRAYGEILEQDRKDKDFLYSLFYGGEIGLKQKQDKRGK